MCVQFSNEHCLYSMKEEKPSSKESAAASCAGCLYSNFHIRGETDKAFVM